LTESVLVDIRRNPDVYGKVRFLLWNADQEQTAPNAEIDIDGHRAKADEQGVVELSIPLAEQKPSYPLQSSLQLVDKKLTMPCGPNDIVQFK
jgi:hypothetical protein